MIIHLCNDQDVRSLNQRVVLQLCGLIWWGIPVKIESVWIDENKKSGSCPHWSIYIMIIYPTKISLGNNVHLLLFGDKTEKLTAVACITNITELSGVKLSICIPNLT